MHDVNPRTDWNGTWMYIRQLWPKWNPSPAEMTLYRKSLSDLNQIWVIRSVDEHYRCSRRKSVVYPYLPQILDKFRAIKTPPKRSGETERELEKAQDLGPFMSAKDALGYSFGEAVAREVVKRRMWKGPLPLSEINKVKGELMRLEP